MKKRVFLLLVIRVLAATDVASQALSSEQMATFLKTARVVKARQSGSKGVTRPWRLTLSDGTLTHDALFQSVDEKRAVQEFQGSRRPEMNVIDSWRFNVAASGLTELLGIQHMMPVTVEHRWDNKDGALTWWADDVLMDEGERRKSNADPPDNATWNQQNHRMRVFAQLVHDTDRNAGNILITRAWNLVMIDFTRAFRQWDLEPNAMTTLRRCDRTLLASLRALTEPGVKTAVSHSLTEWEIRAVMKERDQIVAHFDSLIARLGEVQVLYR